jgi:hypothetical protein
VLGVDGILARRLTTLIARERTKLEQHSIHEPATKWNADIFPPLKICKRIKSTRKESSDKVIGIAK